MIANLLKYLPTNSNLDQTKLYDEISFYPALSKDLSKCDSELIIESPFITSKRVGNLLPYLKKLKKKRVRIAVITRDPRELSEDRRPDSYIGLSKLMHLGIQVVFCKDHHRKAVIIDRRLLYEGSLNVLSQNDSREIMRRIESVNLSWQMIGFVDLDKYIN